MTNNKSRLYKPFEAFLIHAPRKWSISSRKIHRSQVVSICGPFWPFGRCSCDSIMGALSATRSALISLVLPFLWCLGFCNRMLLGTCLALGYPSWWGIQRPSFFPYRRRSIVLGSRLYHVVRAKESTLFTCNFFIWGSFSRCSFAFLSLNSFEPAK